MVRSEDVGVVRMRVWDGERSEGVGVVRMRV